MSVAPILVIAWLVVLPVGFLLLAAVYPRYLRRYVARGEHRLVQRVELPATASREARARPAAR